MPDKTLEEALAEEQTKEQDAVAKASKSVVKPDLRKLPPTRAGKKKLSTWVDPEVHQEMKIIAAKEDKTIEDVVRDGVNLKRIQHGLPPIA